jgi:hypothetical protein
MVASFKPCRSQAFSTSDSAICKKGMHGAEIAGFLALLQFPPVMMIDQG